jgi:hypothetical protein
MAMTLLTGTYPASTYGDILTCNNHGMGLTVVLQNVQDGLANNSAIQLSTLALNVTGAFQLGGVPITSSAAQINAGTGPNPVFSGTYVVMPSHTTGGRPGAPVAGTMGFNTTTTQMEYWNGAAWISF